MDEHTRRDFLRFSASVGFLGGLGSLGALGNVLAEQGNIGPDRVRLSTDIEPIVRVIEETSREKIFAAAAQLLRSGVDYRQFMAALYLAGIRNVDSRSSGSRFHCVYVINSAHQLALESPAQERFLPLFWALDDFKGAQASRPRPMLTLDACTPSGADAIGRLRAAVHCWDRDAAEIALAGMARTCRAAEIFEELWRLGARDFRPIGHKAIFVTNTWRTLEIIGWQHAEPALRSLGQALAGNGTQFENGLRFEDQCHRKNDELVQAYAAALPRDWVEPATSGAAADAATAAALLAPVRAGNAAIACCEALALLTQSKARAGAIWDVVHLAAAEFMLRNPDLGSVHAVTSVNALHFGFRVARSTETRLFLLLQAVGWMAHFALTGGLAAKPNPAPDENILNLARSAAGGLENFPDDPVAAAEYIVNTMATDRSAVARGAFGFATRHANHPALLSAARRLVFTRATDPHGYKYPAAAFEDISVVSPAWQPHMLAASMLYIPAPSVPESGVIQRAKEAVAGL
ncbi:MAG: hypothetical protein ACKVX7_02985 [Planctomycetota bacterium]